MSESRWKSVFRQKARREQEAGKVEIKADERFQKGGSEMLESKEDLRDGSPADRAQHNASQLSDPIFSTDICRIGDAERHLDLIKNMRDSLENIWVSLMIGKEARPRTLMICGAAAGEGATFLSFYLSLFMALEHGRRVLYIDTDMTGAKNDFVVSEHEGGLLAFFDKGIALPSLVHGTEFEGLYVLPGGKGQHRTGPMGFLWHKERLSSVVAFCHDYFDIAVFDSQPVVSNPAMIEYARTADQVLLVCRYGQSRREVTRLAVDKLAAGGVTIGGVILNAREYPVPPKVYKSFG